MKLENDIRVLKDDLIKANLPLMIIEKTKLDQIRGAQLVRSKYQGLGYVRQEPKNKSTTAQATSSTKNVTKVLKPKVSIPISQKVTTSGYGYTCSHNTRNNFVPTYHHWGRLDYTSPYCYDLKHFKHI